MGTWTGQEGVLDSFTVDNSTAVKEAAWDGKEIFVEFHNGSVYAYEVAEHIWTAFRFTESKGRFVQSQLKNMPYRKVK